MHQWSVFSQKRLLERSLSRCGTILLYLTLGPSRGGHTGAPVALPKYFTILKGPKLVRFQNTVTSACPETLHFVSSLSTSAPHQLLKSIRASPSLSSLFSDRETFRNFVESLAQSPNPQYSLKVLHLANNLGLKLHQNVYECTIYRLAALKKWDMILSVVNAGKRHTGRTTSRLLNWRARALIETQSYSHLYHILDEFRRANQVPSQRTFHLVLSGCLLNHDLEGAKACLQSMADIGFTPNAFTDALIAKFYRPFAADLRVRRRALESLPTLLPLAGLTVLNNLIQAALNSHDIPSVLHFLESFDQASINIIRPRISADLDLHIRILSNEASLRGLPPLAHGIKPNAATFVNFINDRARKADLPGAIELVKGMTSLGISPTPAVIAALVHAYFAAGQGNTAIRIIEGMQRTLSFQPLIKDVEPDVTHGVDDELPFKLFGIPLNIQILNVLFRETLRRQGLNHACFVFSILHANNLQPTAHTLEILLAHLKNVEGANPRILFHVLRKFSSPVIQPTLRHLRIILSCVVRQEIYRHTGSGWRAFAAKYPRRPKACSPPHRFSGITSAFDPTAGIEILEPPLHRSFMKSIVESLNDRKVKSDPFLMALRIRLEGVLNSDMDAAQAVFRTMLARGILPNEYHFSALMEGFVRIGDIKAAVDILKTAEQSGVKANVVLFTIIITGYARMYDPNMALRTFQQMTSVDISPDVASIDAVVSAFFAVGAYSTCRRLLTTLWTYIQPFPETLRDANLRVLAVQFRSLHSSARTMKLSKSQKIALHTRVKRILNSFRFHFSARQRQDRIQIPAKSGRRNIN
jgi:pentatricopeptide repeat protein